MADGAIVLQTCLKTLVISFAIPFGATSGAEMTINWHELKIENYGSLFLPLNKKR